MFMHLIPFAIVMALEVWHRFGQATGKVSLCWGDCATNDLGIMFGIVVALIASVIIAIFRRDFIFRNVIVSLVTTVLLFAFAIPVLQTWAARGGRDHLISRSNRSPEHLATCSVCLYVMNPVGQETQFFEAQLKEKNLTDIEIAISAASVLSPKEFENLLVSKGIKKIPQEAIQGLSQVMEFYHCEGKYDDHKNFHAGVELGQGWASVVKRFGIKDPNQLCKLDSTTVALDVKM